MLNVLVVVMCLLLIAFVIERGRRDPDEVIADRLEHLSAPWRDLTMQLGFGFTAAYDDVRRTYAVRGNDGDRAVTVEYTINDLHRQLAAFPRAVEEEPTSRLKVTVHLRGGLPEGLRVRHDPSFASSIGGHDEVLTGEPDIDEAVSIRGAFPSATRAYVRRPTVLPLLREFAALGHGAVLSEFELMITLVGDEADLCARVPSLVDRAVALAHRFEWAATAEWRAVADKWGLELHLGSGGDSRMLVGMSHGADIQVQLQGSGAALITEVVLGWSIGLPNDFRVTERARREPSAAPEVSLGYAPIDDNVRVFAYDRRAMQVLLADPHVATALLDVVTSFAGATIETHGVALRLPGDADARALNRAIEASLTLFRRLRRQVKAAVASNALA